MRQLGLFILAAALLGACDAKPIANQTADALEPSRKPIEGYVDLKFGMTLMAALGEADADRFNPYGLKECLNDLPLKGCFLSPDTDAAPFLIEAGIPYKLGLSFNKFDKLTDIDLSYRREGGISFDECRSLHERTVDWLSLRYGQLIPQASNKERLEARKTPGGNSYFLYRSPDGNFVAGFMRTAATNLPLKVRQQPINKWDNERYVGLLSHYIVVDGKPFCTVGLEFREPESVERRILTSEPATAESEAEATPTHLEPSGEEMPLVDANGEPIDDDKALDEPNDY